MAEMSVFCYYDVLRSIYPIHYPKKFFLIVILIYEIAGYKQIRYIAAKTPQIAKVHNMQEAFSAIEGIG
jgi:hypothetical protein